MTDTAQAAVQSQVKKQLIARAQDSRFLTRSGARSIAMASTGQQTVTAPLEPLDLCYVKSLNAAKTVTAAKQALAKGRPVRMLNLEPCYWQDAWDAKAKPDRAWLPCKPGSSQPSHKLSPTLREALMARTLPKRLAGAQAALRANRDDQYARLLLLQCLPDGPAKDEAIQREGMKAWEAVTAEEPWQRGASQLYLMWILASMLCVQLYLMQILASMLCACWCGGRTTSCSAHVQ